jgi:hypothetical protein
MRYLLLFIAFIAWALLGRAQSVYYVAADGSASNTGLTTASPWTIQKAAQEVVAGDIVHVRKGIYTNPQITITQSGTASQPIRFIGYNNTPNDIVSTDGPTYEWNTPVDGNTMPLFRGSRSGLVATSNTAIRVEGSFVQIENIKTQYYNTPVVVVGNFNTLRNVHSHQAGDLSGETVSTTFNGIAYIGKAINILGNNNNIISCYAEDADAEAIIIRGNFNYLNKNEVHARQTLNTLDYYLLIQGGSNNLIQNTLIYRHGNVTHYGHGICFKSPNPTINNIIEDFEIINTNLELQFQGVNNNTVRRGTIIKLSDGGPSDAIGGITMANASHSNHLEDIYIDNANIRFAAWLDGLPGLQTGISSYNNTFNRITVNFQFAAIMFSYFGNNQYNSAANDNKFYNCTFNSGYSRAWMFERSRPASGLIFRNCIFNDITSMGFPRATSPGFNYTATWDNNAFWGSTTVFNNLLGTKTNNTTNVNPLFTNVNAKDFSLQAGSPLRGQGVATPFMSAGNDIGAWQSNAPTPEPEPEPEPTDDIPPSLVSQTVENVDFTSFRVSWTLNEGSKGRIYFDTNTGTNIGDYPNFTNIENSFLTFHRQTVGGSNPAPLTAGTTYYYRYYLEDVNGNIALSPEYTVTTLGEEAPEPEDTTAPSLVGAPTIQNITNTSFQVEWNLDEGSKGRIFFGTTSGTTIEDYTAFTALENSFITFHRQTVGGTNPAPLEEGTTYYFRIYTEDSNGNSRLSAEYTATTLGDESEIPDPEVSVGKFDLRALFLKKKKL